LKKILLSEEHTSRPVPTLSDRQFVVDKSGLSTMQEKMQRELFWYREEVISCVKARWREVGASLSSEY
jgi:trafficking protein particle complex subunit 9